MRYEYECPNKDCNTTDFTADKPLSKYKEPAKCPKCGTESPKVMKTPVPRSQSWRV